MPMQLTVFAQVHVVPISALAASLVSNALLLVGCMPDTGGILLDS